MEDHFVKHTMRCSLWNIFKKKFDTLQHKKVLNFKKIFYLHNWNLIRVYNSSRIWYRRNNKFIINFYECPQALKNIYLWSHWQRSISAFQEKRALCFFEFPLWELITRKKVYLIFMFLYKYTKSCNIKQAHTNFSGLIKK